MIEELERNGWVAIHSQLIDPRPNKSYWEEGEDFHWRMRFNSPGEKKFLGAVVCLIKKEIILKYKFDMLFNGAAEDSDFFNRVSLDGNKVGVSTAVAYHFHRASLKSFIRQRIWYGKGNARIIRKYRCISLFFVPIAIILYGSLISIFAYHTVKLIPFYVVWGISLFLGTFIGIGRDISDYLTSKNVA